MTPKRRAAIAKRKIASIEKMINELGGLYQDIDNSIYEEIAIDGVFPEKLAHLRELIDHSHDQEEKFTLLQWGQ